MSLLSSAFCLKCEKMYDLESRKMCTGKCNHSICETCFDKKLSNSCPTCETVNAFEEKHINYQAQEMLNELIKTFSVKNFFKESLGSKNIGEGACSECRLPSKRLRVCADCSLKSGLLTLDKYGDLQLSTETANELLETKILRIHSVAICADCALDGTKHKGHKLEFVTKIEEMEKTVEALDILSAINIFSRKTAEEAKDCKEMKMVVATCSFFLESKKVYEYLLEQLNESERQDSRAVAARSLVTIVNNGFAGFQSVFKQALDDESKELKQFMEKLEDKEEREGWKSITDKLEFYREQFSSQNTSFDWKANVLEAVKIYESGFFEDFFTTVSSNSNAAREISDITKDLRRTLKLPREVEKYATVAGSVLQLFFGGEEKKVEELDLD